MGRLSHSQWAQQESHEGQAAVERSPAEVESLGDLEHEIKGAVSAAHALRHVRSKLRAGQDLLDRIVRPQVDPVLGRIVVEGSQVVPVAEQLLRV
jgi:hypothetical protein